MTAPVDHVFVYNRTGQMVAEVSAHVARSTHLDRVGRGVFTIPVSDPKFSYELIQKNNIVLVINETVGNWIGFMWGRYAEGNGSASIDVMEMGYKLQQRRTAAVEVQSGDSGTVFENLIDIANQSEDTLIKPDSDHILHTGYTISRTYNAAKIYEAIEKLAGDFGYDWWIDGNRDGSGLIISAGWGTRGQTVLDYELIEGRDLHNVQLLEEGEIINDVLAYGLTDTSDWSSVLTAIAEDEESIALFGRCQGIVAALDTEDETTLGALAASLVSRQKLPRFSLIADLAGDYCPRVGDVVEVMLRDTGFVNRKRGGRRTMRVNALSFDPAGGGTVSITLKEV